MTINFSASAQSISGRVDRAGGIIRGAAVITGGITAKGHDLEVDDVLLNQVIECGNAKGRVQVKLNHRDPQALQSICGYITGFRREGNKVVADWHLLKTHDEFEKIMERAERMPECFAMERRNEPKSRNPVTMRIAQGALSQAAARVIELEEPALTGKVARDRYVKKLKDEDQARRDSNLLRAGTTGALAGALLPWRKLKTAHRALVGAGAGAAATNSLLGDRHAHAECQLVPIKLAKRCFSVLLSASMFISP